MIRAWARSATRRFKRDWEPLWTLVEWTSRVVAVSTAGAATGRRLLKSGALVVGVSLLLTGCTDSRDVFEKETRDTGSRCATSATVSDSRYFGVNTHFIWEDSQYLEKSIGYMQQAGVQTVRFDLPWNVLEPKSGEFDHNSVARLDNAVDSLVARHIEPIAVVSYSPSWASGSSNPWAPPRNDSDYNAFLGFWIKRWAGKVNSYEVWNEPNYYWYPKPDPARYTDLLKSAYVYAKQLDPSLTILGGSLSGSDGDETTGPQWFLQQMYADGAKDYFDVLSQHGFSWPLNAEPPRSIFEMFQKKMLPIMRMAGDGDKPIWWTETGYPTGGPQSVSESTQAAYLVQAYQVARATLPTIQRVYYYEWTNDHPTLGAQESVLSQSNKDYFGIIDPFSEPTPWRLKPAYTSLMLQLRC
jgi:hypothetical protein